MVTNDGATILKSIALGAQNCDVGSEAGFSSYVHGFPDNPAAKILVNISKACHPSLLHPKNVSTLMSF